MSVHVHHKQTMEMKLGKVALTGDINLPMDAEAVVLFAHGSGSSRHSTRNQAVARIFSNYGLGTLLFDLLSQEEEEKDQETGELRFDIDLLADRLIQVTHWVQNQSFLENLRIGYFGASTGAAAALIASTQVKDIYAIVSRGGRPDLAPRILPLVQAPTLLIIGENDPHVLSLNRKAFEMLHCHKQIEIIPGASHLFEEPGTMNEVAQLALVWFQTHLIPPMNKI
jgi:putative phosphoribosyl transferase